MERRVGSAVAGVALAQVSQDGDWFLGRRLPEFRISWQDTNQIHPLAVIGRQVRCEIHDGHIPSVLADTDNSPHCHRLAREWHTAFTTAKFAQITGRNMVWLGYSEDLLRIALSVKATMMSAVKECDPAARGLSYEIMSDSSLMTLWLQPGAKALEDPADDRSRLRLPRIISGSPGIVGDTRGSWGDFVVPADWWETLESSSLEGGGIDF